MSNASNRNSIREELEKAIENNDIETILKIYKEEELRNKKNIYEALPPFTKTSKEVYKHRLDNLELYEKVNKKLAEENFGQNYLTDYGIKDRYAINDLPTICNQGNKDCFPFAFDDNLRDTLIKDVKKYLIKKPTVSENGNKAYVKSYYIGKHRDQYVLFSEVLTLPKRYEPNDRENFSQLSDFDMSRCSYSLNAILFGDKKGEMMLLRYDYLPTSNHINKTIDGKLNVFGDSVSVRDYESVRGKMRTENVAPGHMHKLTKEYSLVFPNNLGGCDAVLMPLRFDNYKDFINFNRENSNIEDRYVLFKDNENNYQEKSIVKAFEHMMEENESEHINELLK